MVLNYLFCLDKYQLTKEKKFVGPINWLALITSFLVSVILLMSCSNVEEINTYRTERNTSQQEVLTKSKTDGEFIPSSPNEIRRIQSNPYIIMAKQVVIKDDGFFYIQITKEDASVLGISDDIYDLFYEYVCGLNKEIR